MTKTDLWDDVTLAAIRSGWWPPSSESAGKPVEAINPLRAWIAAWEASGGKVRIPILKAFLAEAMTLTGALDIVLPMIDEGRPHQQKESVCPEQSR
jgi:hypothetical protein